MIQSILVEGETPLEFDASMDYRQSTLASRPQFPQNVLANLLTSMSVFRQLRGCVRALRRLGKGLRTLGAT